MPEVAALARDLCKCREEASSRQHSLIELDIRIWKLDLDAQSGPDLLKEPKPVTIPKPRLN
jgi:hypothetical protein